MNTSIITLGKTRSRGVFKYAVIQHSKFLSLGSVVSILTALLHYCSPICKDEIAGSLPNMKIKVATYVITHCSTIRRNNDKELDSNT